MSDIKLNVIKDVIESISNYQGEDYFNQITLSLDKNIQSDYTFIAKLNREEHSSQTISLVANGKVQENFKYDLKDTPCADVLDSSVCCYPDKVCDFYPKDQLLIDMKIKGYIGTPLLDSSGEVMGLIVALYENEIKEEEQVIALFQLFSGRIAAELEREDYEKKLKEMNEQLDNKVKERTFELEKSLQELKVTQEQLIESEKMASIAVLVTGIAHEVNTPLGVAITTNSLIQEAVEKIEKDIESKKLSLDKLLVYKENLKESVRLQTSNLTKSKELIDNFKKTSVEHYAYNEDVINFNDSIKELIKTMSVKTKGIDISVDCENFEVKTFLSVHYQIISNLILNTTIHAFDKEESHKKVKIKVEKKNKEIKVTYEDNGKGIPEENMNKLFSPFFTTGRGKGCSGLGLYVIYNLVKQKLKGGVEILPEKEGFKLIYKFKELS